MSAKAKYLEWKNNLTDEQKAQIRDKVKGLSAKRKVQYAKYLKLAANRRKAKRVG